MDLVDGQAGFRLETLPAAYAFVAGLASAHHAQLRAAQTAEEVARQIAVILGDVMDDTPDGPTPAELATLIAGTLRHGRPA